MNDLRTRRVEALKTSLWADGWSIGDPDEPGDENEAFASMTRALDAALAIQPEPVPGARVIDIAVAFREEDQSWSAEAWSKSSVEEMFEELASNDFTLRLAIVRAVIPPPAPVPTIEAEVNKP